MPATCWLDDKMDAIFDSYAALTAEKYLKSKKVDSFEVYYIERRGLLVNSKERRIETFHDAFETGLAVRIIDRGRLGFSYTTAVSDAEVREAVDMAILSSREAVPDHLLTFTAQAEVKAFEWPCDDMRWADIDVSQKTRMAIRLEEAALAADPRVRRVKKAEYEEARTRVTILNSEGLFHSFQKTLFTLDVVAAASANGDNQWAWDTGFSYIFDNLNPEDIGRNAAERAVSLLGARRLTGGRMPLLLHPYVSAQLLGVFAKSFYGDNVYKKKSRISDMRGDKLYAECVNIIDDPLLEGGYASAPFDGEGHSSRCTRLVDKGVVMDWLTDGYWGKKLGVGTAGSSVRDSIKAPPSVGISNLYIEPAGNKTREKLLMEMSDGLFVTGVTGMHTINPITGDFSIGAEGQKIEGGKKAFPVNGVMIAGNLHELFRDVLAVGCDLRFIGNLGSPSILVQCVQTSGRNDV